jgi:hypothetical protein
MTVSSGPTRTASSGPTRDRMTTSIGPTVVFLAASSWPTLPAGQGRSSSLRCGRSTLTCGSSSAIGQQSRKPAFQDTSQPVSGGGAVSSRHPRCPIRGGAASGRPSGSTWRRYNQPVAFHEYWSGWRRRRQASARKSHYARRARQEPRRFGSRSRAADGPGGAADPRLAELNAASPA